MPCDTTNEWGLDERSCDVNYQRWIGPNERGRSIPIPQRKGSFAKGGNPMFTGGNLKTDHGVKAYKDIDCALKINERAIAKTCLY